MDKYWPDQLRFNLPTYHAWWWMLPVLWLACALGANYLTVDDLWTDEVATLRDVGGDPYAARSAIDVWNENQPRGSNHPPGYFVAVNLWGQAAGWSEFSLRVFSLLHGLLAVAVTYRLGRKLFSASTGLYAALILASSSFFVFYMHEGRGYALLALLTVFTYWMYWSIVYTPDHPGWAVQIGFVVGSAAIPYVSFWGLVILAALGLFHLVFAPRNARWWWMTGLAVVAGIMLLPTVNLLTGAYALDGLPNPKDAPGPTRFVELILTIFSHANLPLLAVAGAYALVVRERNLRAIWFLTLVMLGLYITANVYRDLIPKDRMRYVIPLWPLMALLVAVSVERMVQRGLRPELILGVWLVVAIPHSWSIDFMRDVATAGSWTPYWSQLADSVQEKEAPGDVLVILSRYRTWGHDIPYYMYPLESPHAYISSWRGEIDLAQEGIDEATQLAETAERIWVAYDNEGDAYDSTAFHNELKQNFVKCDRTAGGPDFWLWEYNRWGTSPLITFGDTVVPSPGEISLRFLRIEPAQATQLATVTMGWSAAQRIANETYHVQLDVIDAQGDMVLTDTFTLPEMSQTCLKRVLPTTDLIPGDYTVWLGISAWNAPLPGQEAGDGPAANQFRVGTFTRIIPG